MKTQIIEILKEQPDGLKAREIARLLPNNDKKEINSILYSNPQLFVSSNYVWTLKGTAEPMSKNTKPSKKSKNEFLEFIENCFGSYQYWGSTFKLSATIEDEIHKISNMPMEKCISNLKQLLAEPTIEWYYKNKYLTFEQIERIICLAIQSQQAVKTKIERAKKIKVRGIDNWFVITELSDLEYERLLQYSDQIKKIKLPQNVHFIFPRTDLLLHLLEHGGFETIKKHSEIFCNEVKLEKTDDFDSCSWLKIVTLSSKDFSSAINNIKKYIDGNGIYFEIKTHLSLKEVLPFSWLSSEVFFQSLCGLYHKKKIKQEPNIKLNKEFKTISISPSKSSNSTALEVATKCTGNCSTCNKENCPER